MGIFTKLNDSIQESAVGRFFQLKERNTNFTQEMRGGLVTFLTVSYILAVNSGIVSDTGGMCIKSGECILGVPPNLPAPIQNPECAPCITRLRASLISATAASCIVSHVLMGLIGNLPIAIAPAMGLNAYFTYTVVGFMGSGRVAFDMALAAVFIEGFIFMLVTIVGLRSKLVSLIPRSVLLATSAGIGLFLAHIGMQAAEGLGITTYNSATLVTLGGCAPEYRTPQFTIPLSAVVTAGEPDSICSVLPDGKVLANGGLFVPSGSYACASAGVMRSATTWLGIAGGVLMAVLLAKNVRGAMAIGILFVTFISWIPSGSNAARYIARSDGCTPDNINTRTNEPCVYTPEMRRWDFFKRVVAVPDTSETAGKFDFSGFKDGQLWLALITFLYVDFLDATGTFYSMANFLSAYIPGFVNKTTKQFPRQTAAFMVDGASISVGACLGTPPLTAYIESAAGIREGARTGLSSLMVAFCFFIALFFSPLLATIPPYATGPALILVGAMMMVSIVKIKWTEPGEAIPAFLTAITMPLTYSVAYGFIAGIFGWILVNGSVYAINFVQAKLFPNSVDSQLRGGKTWRIARQMTFSLDDDAEDEDMDVHGIAPAKGDAADPLDADADAPVEPATAKV